MCKRTLFAFVLPLFFGLLPSFSRAAHPETFAPDMEAGCQAPAPTGLGVYSVTPNSVSLVWVGPASTGIYYEVGVYDLTIGAPLPSVYTRLENTTVTGLSEGHCYEFQVRASYCSFNPADMGSWSNTVEGCTGVIIIDITADFPAPSGDSTSGGTYFDVCIERSTSAMPEYNKGVVFKFTYRLNSTEYLEEQFGLGLPPGDEWDLHLNTLTTGTNPFSYQYVGQLPNPPATQGTEQVEVVYTPTNTPIIRITNNSLVNPTSPYAVAETNIELLSYRVSTIKYWSAVNCATSLVHSNKPKWQASHQDKRPVNTVALLTQPSPNPFSHSTTFNYTVPEAGPVDIRLYDALGRLSKVVWQNPAQEAGQYGATVLGEGLPNGLYLLHVQTGDDTKVYRLLKQD